MYGSFPENCSSIITLSLDSGLSRFLSSSGITFSLDLGLSRFLSSSGITFSLDLGFFRFLSSSESDVNAGKTEAGCAVFRDGIYDNAHVILVVTSGRLLNYFIPPLTAMVRQNT